VITKPETRYAMRKNDVDDYWTVYDKMTSQPAEVDGSPLTRCEIEEADYLVDLLNAEYLARCKGSTH
jgi:hypothetical protein